MTAPLKPCPFCGSVDLGTTEIDPEVGIDSLRVWCLNCGAQGPRPDDNGEEGPVWNARAAEEGLPADNSSRLRRVASAPNEFDRISKALIEVRNAFAAARVPPPNVLEWMDAQQGYDAKLWLHAYLADLGLVKWGMTPGAECVGEYSLAGFIARFEARKIERPGTGAELDDGVTGRVFDPGARDWSR